MAVSGSGQNFPGSIVEDDASSNTAPQSSMDSQHSVTTSPQIQEKTLKTVKKVVPRDYIDPEQFIEHIVFRKNNGETILGTVHYFDRDMNMFYVDYEDDVGLFLSMDDLFNQLATEKEFVENTARLLKQQQKENAENPKPEGKPSTSKKGVTKKVSVKGKAIANIPAPPPFDPMDYLRRNILKKHNGKTTLGSVHYYDPEKDLFHIEFEDPDDTVLGREELLEIRASSRDSSSSSCSWMKSTAATRKK